MRPEDQRTSCTSCGRKDLRLIVCPKCRNRICTACEELHTQYDHRKDK